MAYPPPPKALFVPLNQDDDLVFNQKVKTIKAVITELEDENNLIAYKIAKTRRRIDEKTALLEAKQVPPIPEQRSFWGGRKPVTTPAEVPEAAPPAKGGRKKAAPRRKVKDTPLTTIEPLNARELEYLGNGKPPVNYTPEPSYTPTTQEVPQHSQMDEMEVDDDY